MSYNVTSGFSDLDGTCEISGNDCTSYTSTAKGTGTVNNIGSGSTLNFQVSFSGVTHPYVVTASASGTGYSGNASHGNKRQDESWAATATQVVAASGQS